MKTDRLVDAFIDMAVTCARYEAYLGSVDVDALDKDHRWYEQSARTAIPRTRGRTIAKKNLAIVARASRR